MCGWDVKEMVEVWLLVAVLPVMTIVIWGAMCWGAYELGKYVRKML